jgi:MFS family permease
MTFFLLLTAALLCEVSSNLPVGSLPLALVREGASETQVAVAMGCGMFAALLISLPIGNLVDRVGRLPVLRAAAAATVVVMIAMGLTEGVLAGCLQMALRSAVLIAYMTAQWTYASNIFSKERAVSTVATMGIVGNIAFALGPALGVWLWQIGVHREQFIFASALNLLALCLVMELPGQYDVQADNKRKRRHRFFIRPSWLPTMIYLLTSTMQGGVNGTLAVLAFTSRGIANGALIFTAAALTTFLFRYPAARSVERFGARLMAVPTTIIQSVGCILASQAATPTLVIAAGFCFGIAWAAVVPIGLALFFERSSQRTRGTAMGSFNLAMAGGAALGALMATLITMLGMGYKQAIISCAAIPVFPLILLFLSPRKSRRSAAAMTVSEHQTAVNQ